MLGSTSFCFVWGFLVDHFTGGPNGSWHFPSLQRDKQYSQIHAFCTQDPTMSYGLTWKDTYNKERERRARISIVGCIRTPPTPPPRQMHTHAHFPQWMAASLSLTMRVSTKCSHLLSYGAPVRPALGCCQRQRRSRSGEPTAFAVRVYFCRWASEDMCESARGRLKSWHPAENDEKRGTVSAVTGSLKLRGSLCFVPLPLISLYLAAFAASANRLCSAWMMGLIDSIYIYLCIKAWLESRVGGNEPWAGFRSKVEAHLLRPDNRKTNEAKKSEYWDTSLSPQR